MDASPSLSEELHKLITPRLPSSPLQQAPTSSTDSTTSTLAIRFEKRSDGPPSGKGLHPAAVTSRTGSTALVCMRVLVSLPATTYVLSGWGAFSRMKQH